MLTQKIQVEKINQIQMNQRTQVGKKIQTQMNQKIQVEKINQIQMNQKIQVEKKIQTQISQGKVRKGNQMKAEKVNQTQESLPKSPLTAGKNL